MYLLVVCSCIGLLLEVKKLSLFYFLVLLLIFSLMVWLGFSRKLILLF